jgi:4-amino-4-deoxy-L-arabinose transferase-like glycosyltransferase
MKLKLVLLLGILLLSLAARLYHFNFPMADLHSWRQADTAAVARNLTRFNLDVLHPRIDSHVSIDGIGRDNTQMYHFAEFPIYQWFVAVGSFVTGDIITSGRAVSIVSSLISIVFLYLLCRRFYSENVSLFAAFIFGILPYNIFWSRTILPDPMMLTVSLVMLYFFVRYVQVGKVVDLGLAFFFFGLGLLLKPFVVFLLLPVGYLLFKKFGWKIWRRSELWVGAVLAVLPFVAWRIWMQNWPMGIPASGWLLDGSRLRFKPAWWHWIFQMRLDRYMFNFTGLTFIGISLFFYKNVFEKLKALHEKWKTHEYLWFFPLCMLSCLVYVIIFATGNVQHEYYQLPITAFGSVFISLGFWYVWSLGGSLYEVIIKRLFSVLMIGICLLLGWYSVRDWYSIGNPMLVTVGKRADAILPKDAKVVADYGGDTTFLYYVNRTGWSVRDKQLQEMIDRGATHYVSMHRNDYMNRLATLYEIVDETPEYVILDLRQKKGDWSGIAPYSL